MTTIKVKFRPSSVEGQEGSIYYQVLYQRVARQIATVHKVFPAEWDAGRGNVVASKDSPRKARVSMIRESIKVETERLNRIVRRLEDRGVAFTADDVCEEYRNYATQLSFVGYTERQILRLAKNGKVSTMGHYKAALASFTRFLAERNEDDIMLDNITIETIVDYQAFLQSTDIKRNTISFYMRILRSIYNKAVDDRIIEQANPFKRAYTGIEKTVKRAISLDNVSKVRTLDLSGKPKLDYARDMFILAFYFRGMSFVDMAYLKKTDLSEGWVTYQRRKTGQQLKIRWVAEMQNILDKYPENTSDYLLPIIRRKGLNEYYAYRNALNKVNRSLKEIGQMLGLELKLTHYVSRHSWASGARAKGVAVNVISEGMGHDSELTTQIYLAQLDTTAVDEANEKLIEALKK